ncbi:MAG: hypothetical protein NVSMB9_09950 [Isosphaeraceae bacterium]
MIPRSNGQEARSSSREWWAESRMRRTGPWIASLALVLSHGVPTLTLPARAEEPVVRPSPAATRLKVPAGLPRYEIDARLDLHKKQVTAVERVRFTNRSSAVVTELVFHVYPRYRIRDQDRAILSKTLEVLRLSPDEAMDTKGRRLSVASVRVGSRAASFGFDPKDDTILVVSLPQGVGAGESVDAEIAFSVELPSYWGRWGHHNGVTYLLNWYPVLAHHDERGWERTPFVPWHQPWHQEAGHYSVRLDVPEDQVVASSGRIVKQERAGPGRTLLRITASPARDFALVCSNRFETLERRAGSTLVRVHTFPENRVNAEAVLDSACEVIPLYEKWFGPYFDDEFEIATSYFGWNGNECSGLVLIDERIMRLPSAGVRYLDHLVTHETCHQWFWNVVGTDGYAETFMDEGLVNCFTALRLDAKYGRNAPIIVWPKGLGWLPTIGREDLRLSGYYGWRARGNTGPVIQNIEAMGNLNALFSLAYDRGGKVVEMIHNRLGPERFFAFFGRIYQSYAFRTFHYADLRRELIEFDPGGGWDRFLDGWLLEHGDNDWSVERVHSQPRTGGTPAQTVTVELRQKGQMVEPTVLLFRSQERDLRVPIWPERGTYEVPGARVSHENGNDRWVVTVDSPAAPTQVEVDPDHALLDAVPDNNRWRPEIRWRLTPFMSALDQSSQFQAYDRTSVVAGPFIDQYARGGFKVAAQRPEQWQVSAWAGTEPALREAIFGGQATLLHVPWPSWAAGLFYEEGLYNFYNDRRHSGGRAFLRYRFLETSSFLVDDQGFAELYFGTGNEFWAGDDGRPVNGWLDAIGARYRLSTLFPYWDPVQGRLLEFTAEYGDKSFGSFLNYARMTAEYGVVRPLPDMFGRASRSRLAFRAYGGISYPDDFPLFRLGGGRRLRALDLGQNVGSSVWLTTLEWRYPLWAEIDRDAIDHVIGFRNLLGAVFYDVGQSYLRGSWSPVVHGVGVGIRIDVALFAFLERASLRVDLAQPVGIGTRKGPIVWFGLNQVF